MTEEEFSALGLDDLPLYDESDEEECKTLDCPLGGVPVREAVTASDARSYLADSQLSPVGAIRFRYDEGTFIYVYFHPKAA